MTDGVVWSVAVQQEGGRLLQEAMQQNKTMTHMDVRLSECGHEVEYCVNQILVKNRERRQAPGTDICVTADNNNARTLLRTKLG